MMVSYKLDNANETDISKLIEYKLRSIFSYAKNLPKEEINKITSYVQNSIPKKIKNYRIVCVDNKKVGCILLENKDDGVLLDEIYLEENYRNKGIGSNIINKIISENNIIYLWVYKLNIRAISLYRRLGFKVIQEDENRYYMKFDSTLI